MRCRVETGGMSGLWDQGMGNGTWVLNSDTSRMTDHRPLCTLSHVTDTAEQAPLKALRENSFSGGGTCSGSRNGLIKGQLQSLPHGLAWSPEGKALRTHRPREERVLAEDKVEPQTAGLSLVLNIEKAFLFSAVPPEPSKAWVLQDSTEYRGPRS